MRDDLMGGLLATVVAAPVLIVCCGGGGVVLAGLLGVVGGGLGGLNWIAVTLAAVGVGLTWRTLRRRMTSGACRIGPTTSETERNG